MATKDEPELKFDKVDKWTEVKLEIIQRYASAYSIILGKQSKLKSYWFKAYYIDSFGEGGYQLAKSTDKKTKDSPLVALSYTKDFYEYHFIELDEGKGDLLKSECERKYPNKKIQVYSGQDCNEILLGLFPKINYVKYQRALCLLDPCGLHLNWDTIEAAGKTRATEILLNFPVMDIHPNVLWYELKQAYPQYEERMNKFWGDDSWKTVAYKDDPQQNLFGEERKIKEDIINVVKAYIKRLKDKAGFRFVSDPLPMRNSKDAVVYYLIFMSPNKTAHKIMRYIFSKHQRQQKQQQYPQSSKISEQLLSLMQRGSAILE